MPRPSTPSQVRRPTTPEIDVEPPLPVRRPRRVAPAPIQEQVAPPKRTRRETGPRRTAASVEREYQKLIEQMQLDHDASLASLRMQITALKDAAKAQRVPWAETPNGKKWFCIATIFVIAIFAAWAEGRNSVHRFDLIGQDSAGNTIALYSVSHDTVADHLLSMPHIGDRRTLADGRTFALISGQWALVTPPANTTPKVPARRKVHEPGSKEVLADSAQTE